MCIRDRFNSGNIGGNSYLSSYGNAPLHTAPALSKPSLIPALNTLPNTNAFASTTNNNINSNNSSNNNESLFTPPSFIYSTIQQTPVTGTNFMPSKSYTMTAIDNKYTATSNNNYINNIDTFKYGSGYNTNTYVNKSGVDSARDYKDNNKVTTNMPI